MRFMPMRWLLAIAALLVSVSAQAMLIYSTTHALSAADPTQQGRLSRSSIPQDWTMSVAYPGEVNPATSYHYQTFTLDLDALMAGFTYGQYLQVLVDYGGDGGDFVSAYLDGYNPASKGTGWLGDGGFSGNQSGNAGFFQIVAGSGHDLVLLLNDTDGILNPLNQVTIMVEAFTDTMYTDLSPTAVGTVPEPVSLALVAVAFAAMSRTRRRKAA